MEDGKGEKEPDKQEVYDEEDITFYFIFIIKSEYLY